ncbi:MAG TPA: IgGFc-binding protein [Polyangia bacterium]|nr:IgGFc-binding protein [Polyangia bacterium]
MTPCQAGAWRCGPGGSVEQCNPAGSSWMPVAHCMGVQTCSAGQCSPAACSGSAARCTSDGRLETCNPRIGQYTDPVACPVGQTCIGTGCVPTVCTPNQRFCKDDMTVAMCSPLGDNSMNVESCSGNSTCANGGCVSACQAADLLKSFAGCAFYAVDMDNWDRDDPLENDIVVSNSSRFTATVKIEMRQGGNWQMLCMAAVPPQMTHVFALTNTCDQTGTTVFDRHVEDSALVGGLAYRVTSDAPVVAYYYNSDDLNGQAASSGSSVLLPKATLGKKYYALAWPQPPATVRSSGIRTPSGTDIPRASMDVVGSEDGTTVMVTASTRIIMGPGVPMMTPGQTQTFMLNEADVLQLETLMTGDDLSGTYVVADKPVAVFAGGECTLNPNGGTYCDHTEEQMLPLTAWGKNYVAPRMAGQSENCSGTGGVPEVDCPASVWRILGSEMMTTVTMSAPTGVTLSPPGPTFMLGPGMVQEVTARGSSATAPGDFFVSADKPIMVMQLAGGEADMVTAVPVEQYLPTYLFQVPSFFCSKLTVSRKMGVVVLLDGVAIADSLFTDAGGGYQVGRLPIGMRCGSGTMGMADTHTIAVMPTPEGRTFPAGIGVLGVDLDCSYGYVGGLSVQVINDIP